jgi:CBS domain-containing protein
MKLNDVFTRGVITAQPEDTVQAVARLMRDHNVGAVVIVREQRPVGIVTDRDLALALGARGISPQVQVQEVMTRHVLAVPEEMGVYTATQFLRQRGVRRLPIVDAEDRVVGMVSLDDLLRFLGRELHNLAQGIEREMEIK